MREESRGGRILRGRNLEEAGFLMRDESRGGKILHEGGV
jgi:hypothetical protein